MLLEQGFMYLNLENIWGECYENNPALDFWQRLIKKYIPQQGFIWLDCTKYYQGKYWDSLWFNFEKKEWIKRGNSEDDGLRADTLIVDECCKEENKNVTNNT